MTVHYKLLAVCLALLFACVALVSDFAPGRAARAARPAPQNEKATEGARPLTEQERRGRELYHRGASASGREITALVGEVDVPASTLTCAGCHGERAEGKSEGGVTAGALTWSHLVKPYGHTHPSGRRHGPFDERSFVRAVREGVDPDDNELAVAMPRYKISPEDLADLVAYLKRIEFERDPGVADDAIKVGALIPSSGPLAEAGAAMRDVLTAFFDDLNKRGGIFNRRIELKTAETGDGAASTVAGARQLVERERVFALVGGVSAGADDELAEFARAHDLPFIGPSTLTPHSSSPVNRQVFYLLSGVGEQARALVRFAAGKTDAKQTRAAIVYDGGGLTVQAVAAAEEEARKAGFGLVELQRMGRDGAEAAGVARRLKETGAGAVFILVANGADAALIKEFAASEPAPRLFLVGGLATRELTGIVPASLGGRVFVSFPTAPGDVSSEGVAEFRALHEKYRFAPRNTAMQLSAFAAAKVFTEALKRAGRDLTRERLITQLEGLYDYDTGVTPRLIFGPNRRIGASGAYIMGVDVEKKEFVPAGAWVSVN